MKHWNLNGKVALVTGGSKGIGKATVREFLRLGATVIFTGRNTIDLEQAQYEFEREGFWVHVICGDVTDAQHRDAIYYYLLTTHGKLDILVNNAGMNIRKVATAYSEDEYTNIIHNNLISPLAMSTRLLDMLKSAGQGAIINIASIAGSFDVRTGAPYGMAKAGLIQLSRNLANEWATFGIRVNTVSPGFTETPLTKDMLENPERRAKIMERITLKRIGIDEEIAAMISFLAMDKASYITGQNFTVDGGLTSHVAV